MTIRLSKRLSLLALSALPLSAPSCLVIDEHFDQPFDIDPPTQLWEDMDEGHIDDLGRDWIDRCLDSGGVPTVFGLDGFCADRDY